MISCLAIPMALIILTCLSAYIRQTMAHSNMRSGADRPSDSDNSLELL